MKKIIIEIILIILVIGFIIFEITYLLKKRSQMTETTIELDLNNLQSESVMYDEDATIDDLKEEYKMEGNSDLYEIQTEYDGRKVLVIKASEDFKVAFAGLIKKSKPTFEESSQIYNEQYPKENGIWIEPESREKILNDLNSMLKSKYEISDNGYLKIVEYVESENDMILNQIINGEKQCIIGICGTMYYIDAITGEIFDNPYEELDKYQTYSYLTDENKMIIYLAENNDNHLDKKEIYENLFRILKED